MVKKIKSTNSSSSTVSAASAKQQASHLSASVKDSAQQIWLAGMGAFSKAQEEGGKMFETLVKDGLNLQKKTQGLAEDKISEVTGKMTAMADTVTAKAGQNWDKLEAIFEARTAKAMGKLGVPTAKDVDALVKRVDALAAAVAKLSKTAPDKAPRASGNSTAKFAAMPAAKSAAKAPVRRARKTAASA